MGIIRWMCAEGDTQVVVGDQRFVDQSRQQRIFEAAPEFGVGSRDGRGRRQLGAGELRWCRQTWLRRFRCQQTRCLFTIPQLPEAVPQL